MTKKKINAPYDNPFGIWHVTTEGDCEGCSTRDLGIHEGYIDEIALALADKCYYSLCFVAINIHSLDMTPTRKTVDVTFGVNSGTWAMTPKECVTAIKEVNLNTMLSNVLASTCISMSEQEQKAFKERLFKSLSLKMDDNGVVSISIPRFDTL